MRSIKWPAKSTTLPNETTTFWYQWEQEDIDMPPETTKALTTTTGGGVAPTPEKTLRLSSGTEIDVSGLDDASIAHLRKRYAEGAVDIKLEADRLRVQVGALGAGLDVMAGTVKQASAAGNSATITHRQLNEFGQTEAILGNTQQAATGKMPWTSTVLGDHTMKIVVIGAVVVVALALILAR
jgi:hypothetical protein